MGTTIIFRRGENDPTSGSGLTLAEPAFNTTLKTFHIGLGHGITAAWVGAPISGLSADIAAGITYKTPTTEAVKNYIAGLCYGNTGAATITQYVSSFNGLTGAVGGVCAAQANTFTALQTFASGISASGITVGGSMTVTGNLTVSGGVTFTASETVLIEDNIITLNSNVTGSPSENAGVEIERGTSANVQLLWNESSDKWTFTNDGSTYYDLPTSVVTSFNGLTGAVGGVCAAQANTFVPAQNFVGGLCSGYGITAESTISSIGLSTVSGYGAYPAETTVASDTVKFVFEPYGDTNTQTLRPSDDIVGLAGDSITNWLPASSGILALTSQLMGAVNGSTAATSAVTSFNGLTGALQGVSAAVAGTGISVSGATGAVTITNIGVQSFNGLTGAVTGVTVGGANTFTALNSFNAGISSAGATFTDTVWVNSGLIRSSNTGLTLSPSNLFQTGSITTLHIQNAVNGLGRVEIRGGDLYLGRKYDGGFPTNFTASSIVFDGSSQEGDSRETTLTVENPSANRTVTIPNASGTLALTSQLMGAVNGSTAATTAVTSFNGRTGAVQGVSAAVAGTGISVSGATGAVTITNTGVQSFNGNTGAVQGVSSWNGQTGAVSFVNYVASVNGATGAITNVARTNVSNTFTANQFIQGSDDFSPPFLTISTTSGCTLALTSNGIYDSPFIRAQTLSNSQSFIFSPTSPSSSVTLPDFSTTLAGLTGTQTFTGTKTFSALTSFAAGISASGATFGGDIAVNGGDITTTATTATLYNTNATTVTIGSSAGSVTVSSGNTSGMTFGMGFYHKFKTNRVGTLTTLQTEIFRFNYKNASLSVVGGLDAAYAEIIITAEQTPGFGACFGTQITKLLIASNPADTTVFHTEYGNVNTNGNLASYTASISGNDVIVYATPTSSDYTIFKVLATLIRGEFGEGI
jgi:hypothetical protein